MCRGGGNSSGHLQARLLRLLNSGRCHAVVSAPSHQHPAQHGAGDNAKARVAKHLCQRTATPMRTAIPLQSSRHGTSVGCAVARAVSFWQPDGCHTQTAGRQARPLFGVPRRTARDEPPMWMRSRCGGHSRSGPCPATGECVTNPFANPDTVRVGGKRNAPPSTGVASGAMTSLKWAWEELNFRPHAYQACALTN